MINESILRKWWQVFKDGNELVEIRILGKFTYSAYYKNVEKLIADLPPYEELPDEQIYFTLNTINDGCYGRQQCEQMVKAPKATTGDPDIIRRKWVLIDFDPVRTVGVNATDAEFEMARLKAQQVYFFLKEQGFAEPVICKSGNGWHVLYRVDMPNTEDVTETIKGFLQAVAVMFSDEAVDIDQKVFNASRVCKLYGTTAKKGANIPERPWRASTIEYVPETVEVNDIELFRKIANLMPKEEPHQQHQWRGSRGEKFDVEGFLREHGVGFKRVAIVGGVKYVLDECIFDSSHKAPDAAIFQKDSGEIGYLCFHNHCSGYTWRDVRLKLDPTAYDPKPQTQPYLQPQYQPQRVYQPLPQPVHQPVILPETEDKGKKWLTMKTIRKVNLDEMQGFVTGITELDKAIRKLYYGEVTILSGSNASGKTSLLNTLILNCVQQGIPNALYSGELTPQKLKTWLQMAAAGKEFLRPSRYGNSWYVPDNIGEKIDNWMEGRFFIFNDEEYSHRWEQLLADMTELAKAGVKLFTLDNLMSMDIDIFYGDSNKKQKALINQIVDFAKEFQVHVVLVAHPRKATGFIRKTDIAGTSDLSNAVDNVFIVHRVNNDFKKLGGEFFGQSVIARYFGYGNVIEVCKNRQWGVMDQLFGLFYEIESRRFKNTPDEQIAYGWRNDIAQQQTIFDTNNNNGNLPFARQVEDGAPF